MLRDSIRHPSEFIFDTSSMANEIVSPKTELNTIVFVTGNTFKAIEAKTILAEYNIHSSCKEIKIKELQIQDAEELVKDKALKAFGHLKRPLFVEHTGLYLKYLNGLPGGLTQNFWDSLKADKFAELFGRAPVTDVIARTFICYVDGRRFFVFVGEISGKIAPEPRGNRDFQWDCVFVPDGTDQTFSEMGEFEKNKISMRRIALNKLADSIKREASNV